MNIKIFTPHWGYESYKFKDLCRRVAAAGFDGIELNLGVDPAEAEAQIDILEENGLGYIAQHSTTLASDFPEHRAHYRAALERIVEFNPPKINCHTGRDYFTFDQNLELIDIAQEISTGSAVPILHETHRGRFPYHAALTAQYLEARPELRLSADFSHWCCVSESLLQGQEHFVEAAVERSDHIHARIGHEQGPQVNDPRAPEWEKTVELFLGWWDGIIQNHKAAGSETLTITTEFGPWPYTPALPFTGQPVASQWDINFHMMNLLRERYE